MQKFNNPVRNEPDQKLMEIAHILAKGYLAMKQKQIHVTPDAQSIENYASQSNKTLDFSGHQSVHEAIS